MERVPVRSILVAMPKAVGIDLGTTHTVVAWADLTAPSTPTVFPIPQLVAPAEIAARPLFPSCLYAPVPGEVVADPWGEAPWTSGELARRRGAEVPGRLVASAKSWLCHPGVDRAAPILPWGADEGAADLPRISPVEASARYLTHVRLAWDAAFPGDPLAEQEVVLTVPASFDEIARELTLEAAARAGLPVRLLEEPQAAFYDFMANAGDAGMRALLDGAGGEALVLVCDVGGGTTDFSLIRVVRREGEGAEPFAVERVAVGRHLLLGGDNMDLALAHLCEGRLGTKLDAARFGQLVSACRSAKERLLSEGAPESVRVTVLGHGARLVGGTLTAEISREEAERVVLDGFFPPRPGTPGPSGRRARWSRSASPTSATPPSLATSPPSSRGTLPAMGRRPPRAPAPSCSTAASSSPRASPPDSSTRSAPGAARRSPSSRTPTPTSPSRAAPSRTRSRAGAGACASGAAPRAATTWVSRARRRAPHGARSAWCPVARRRASPRSSPGARSRSRWGGRCASSSSRPTRRATRRAR